MSWLIDAFGLWKCYVKCCAVSEVNFVAFFFPFSLPKLIDLSVELVVTCHLGKARKEFANVRLVLFVFSFGSGPQLITQSCLVTPSL